MHSRSALRQAALTSRGRDPLPSSGRGWFGEERAQNRVRASAGGGDDGGEVGGLEAGAADEAAVNVGAGEQVGGVVGLHGAAVLDADGVGGGLTGTLGDGLADDAADAVGLVGGADFAGADGPDGLVGEDDVGGDQLRRDVRQGAR